MPPGSADVSGVLGCRRGAQTSPEHSVAAGERRRLRGARMPPGSADVSGALGCRRGVQTSPEHSDAAGERSSNVRISLPFLFQGAA